MEVKAIVYKRIHNLGNYSSEHVEISAELTEGDDAQTVIQQLKLKSEIAFEIVKLDPITFEKLDDEF